MKHEEKTGKRVLVIGATGFIGVYTCERLLHDGYRVIATGRNAKMKDYLEKIGCCFAELDIADKASFEKLPTEDIEGVILLAGLLPANAKADLADEENAEDYFRINVLGTIYTLEYCRKNGIRKVIGCCSYADVAGAWKSGYAIKESEPRNYGYTGDHAVYVFSKNAANDVMEYYNQQHNMQCAWFRLPPVYGVGPHGTIYVNGKPYRSGIQTFIEKAQNGEDIEIWGDAHIKRDIIYVKDVARAFSLALQSDNTLGLYNMTSGTELDLEEQVRTVIDVFGREDRKSRILYRPEKPNNTPSFLFDMTKAEKDFGFRPQFVSFRELMLDYKKELESGRLSCMTQGRDPKNNDSYKK